MENIAKGDFIEIKYSGYANGELFDSNILEDAKKLNKDAKEEKTVIIVGERMVVVGLDKQLEGKEIGKEYTLEINHKEGFGERKRELIKTIPMSAFKGKDVYPQVGMVLALDQYLAKVIAVSGARVIVDLNNPVAGKDLKYSIKVIRKVTEDKEKAEAYFKFFLGVIPEIEIKENNIIVKMQKSLESLLEMHKSRFKELIGKEFLFEEKQEKNKEEKNSHEHKHDHSEHMHEH